MEVTKHALLANEFIPYPPSWASVLNAMRFIYVYISQVFTVKTTVILLDQLFTGLACGSSRGKGFNNIFSILSQCAPRCQLLYACIFWVSPLKQARLIIITKSSWYLLASHWKLGSLVPKSLVDEAEGEIWSNPIWCTRAWSPVRNVRGDERAHVRTSESRPFLDVLNNDFSEPWSFLWQRVVISTSEVWTN